MNSSMVLNNRKKLLARKIVHKSRVRLPPRDSLLQSPSSNSSSFYVQSLLQNYNNFKKSDVPARLMYREGDSWIDFSENVIDLIKSCFVMRNPMIDVEIGGFLYLFDFYRMLMFSFQNNDEKSVAWIDVNNQCFFPKFVVGSDEFRVPDVNSNGLQKLEIEIRVSGGGELKKRKRECDVEEDVGEDVEEDVEEEVKSEGSCSNVKEFQKQRQVVCEETESLRWMKAKLMEETGKAYLFVKNLVLNWAGIKGTGAVITGIHQVKRTAPMDRARFDGFLNQVEITKAARGDANVTFALLRCSSDGVERILNHGFSNPEKASLGEAFGVGIYLSPLKSTRVSVIPPDAGENHLILCRLILGKCEKVEAGSQQLYPSSAEFDTGVDDVSNPKWYIVWGANMNTHILPECIVSYKHTRDVPGQLSGMPNLKGMPNVPNKMTGKFFSKIIDSLPSSKVLELRTLCFTYKAGKVPKGIFLKKLRSVVGDQMLRSVIEEVRG